MGRKARECHSGRNPFALPKQLYRQNTKRIGGNRAGQEGLKLESSDRGQAS